MARFFGTGLGKRGLYLLGIVALFAIGALVRADTGMLSGADAQPAERAIQPIGAQEATPEPIADTADKTVSEDIAESEDKTDQIEQAVQEPGPPPDEASASASASASTSQTASASASTSSSTPAVAPANTTMYLSVPAMGISDIPVVEGTTEATSHFKNYPHHLP